MHACRCPDESNATMCGKCKSVLRLKDAISISTVQKKLEEQNKTIEKMQKEIDMMSEFMNRVLDDDHARDPEPDAEDDEEADFMFAQETVAEVEGKPYALIFYRQNWVGVHPPH